MKSVFYVHKAFQTENMCVLALVLTFQACFWVATKGLENNEGCHLDVRRYGHSRKHHLFANCTSQWLAFNPTCEFSISTPYTRNHGTALLVDPLGESFLKRETGSYYRRYQYKRSCWMFYSLKSLNDPKAGLYNATVRMYGYVRRGHLREWHASSTLHLEIPRAALRNCPTGNSADSSDNYIRKGSTATCDCVLEERGIPPGTVIWYKYSQYYNTYYEVKYQVRTKNNSVSKFTIGAQVTSGFQYYCYAISELGSTRVEFRPSFAYGPQKVQAQLLQTPIYTTNDGYPAYDLCDTFQGLTIQCTTPPAEVNPGPPVMKLFQHWIENGRTLRWINNLTVSDSNTGMYKIVVGRKRLSPGFQNFTCLGMNSVFHEMNVSDTKTVYFREPPLTAPQLSISVSPNNLDKDWQHIPGDSENDTTITEIVQNSNVTISCTVSGGEPKVQKSDYTISCQSFSGPRLEKHVRSLNLLSITQDNNGTVCWCTAKHATRCYRKNRSSSIQLNVVSMQAESFTRQDEDDLTTLIAAVVVGTLLIVIIIAIIVIVYIYLKRRKDKELSRTPSWLRRRAGSTVVVDNSVLYNSHRTVKATTNRRQVDFVEQLKKDPDTVVIDNSALYGRVVDAGSSEDHCPDPYDNAVDEDQRNDSSDCIDAEYFETNSAGAEYDNAVSAEADYNEISNGCLDSACDITGAECVEYRNIGHTTTVHNGAGPGSTEYSNGRCVDGIYNDVADADLSDNDSVDNVYANQATIHMSQNLNAL